MGICAEILLLEMLKQEKISNYARNCRIPLLRENVWDSNGLSCGKKRLRERVPARDTLWYLWLQL